MSARELKTAQDVSEHLLEITGKSLISGDFDSFAKCFRLPQKMTTAHEAITAHTREDLRMAFDATCKSIAERKVTQLVRECIAASFRGPDRVEATHLSHYLANGKAVLMAFPVFSVLERGPDGWEIVSSDYMVDENESFGEALLAAEIGGARAKMIYQDHLDALGRALLDNDFASFRKRISLPHRITTETDLIEIKTEAEIHDTFSHFAANYANNGLTNFVRTVQTAEFVSKTEIVGTHISHQLRDGMRILPPYPNRVRLVQDKDGFWRETHCANAVLNDMKNFKLWTKVADHPRLPDLDLTP